MTAPGRPVFVLVGSGCLAIAVSACWMSGANFLLLVDQTVVQPQVLALVVWSVAVLASCGLLVVTLLRHRRRRSGRGGGLEVAVVGGALAVVLVGTGTWCAASVVVTAGVRALGQHAYTVLPAPNGQECTLIADETGVLRSSSGRLLLTDAFGVARPVADWRADEIQLPVRDGNYLLKWANGVGTVSFRTIGFIAPSHLEVTCP